MPLYDFCCRECETTFEVQATVPEKQAGLKPECPECQGHTVVQVLRAPMLAKGGGGRAPCCGPGAGPSCCS